MRMTASDQEPLVGIADGERDFCTIGCRLNVIAVGDDRLVRTSDGDQSIPSAVINIGRGRAGLLNVDRAGEEAQIARLIRERFEKACERSCIIETHRPDGGR